MASIAAADGIEQIVSTPHMFNGLSQNPEPSEILERVARLNEAVAAVCGGRLTILPGNEVHISHEIAEQAKRNRVTKINQANYMLVEFPQFTVPLWSGRPVLQPSSPGCPSDSRAPRAQQRDSDPAPYRCGPCGARSTDSGHCHERDG